MPAKTDFSAYVDTILASKQNLRRIRKIEKGVKEYNPILHWTLTPLFELAKFGPEVWADVNEAFAVKIKKKTRIIAPGWDDVIKTGFDTPISPAEMKSHKAALKAGKPSPLSADQLDTLAKRKERAMRIALSPTPSSVRSIGTLLTWYDDIQDSIVALSYAGRLAGRIIGKTAPQLAKRAALPLAYISTAPEMISFMRLWGAGDKAGDIARLRMLTAAERGFASPTEVMRLEALEKAVGRAAKRGGIYTANELEAIKTFIEETGMPVTRGMKNVLETSKRILAHRSVEGGIAITRAARKRNVYAALASLPRLTRKQYLYLRKLKSILPSFAEAVQIAQTTALTTGYGLALGGVVGYASDLVFGSLRGSWHQPVRSLPDLKLNLEEAQTHYPTDPKLFRRYDPAHLPQSIKDYQASFKSPELTPLTMSALKVLDAGSALMSVAGDFSVEDNLFILTAVKTAAVYLNTTQALDDWHNWAKPHLNLPQSAPVVPFNVQDEIYNISPDLVQDKYLLPFMGGVRSITPRLRSSVSAPMITSGFSKWLAPLGPDLRVNYASGIIADLASDIFGALEGPEEEMTTRLSMEGRAVMQLFEYSLNRVLGTPEEIETLLYSQLVDMNIRRHGSSPTFQEVSALIDLFGRLY